ncbi:MAG: SUMF1/EgtB/PvdO family nonheme iron enzyme [Prevotellaceae bacterium]|nr:SUMF1/EgtB/PvdO family nonheme iron enzyme [Prevotellaceae bacterium]
MKKIFLRVGNLLPTGCSSRRSWLLLAVATMTFAGCSKSDDESQAAAEATLTLTPAGQTTIAFAADGTSADNLTFGVTTNQSEWDAASSHAWCTVTKTASGFTVSAAANAATTAPAPATVTVTAGEATPVTISVTQAAAATAAPALTLTPAGQTAITFAADGTSADNLTFGVATNQSGWSAASSQTWCTVTKTASGFTVSAAVNTTTTVPAPATVTVTAGKATSVTISVTQAAIAIAIDEMVFVPGGEATLSGTRVAIDSFYIGKYEVTQKQWVEIMTTLPAYASAPWPGTTKPSNSYGLGDNYPAYYVSWEDVQIFIAQLNQLTGKQYRLPTEAEWEYAARGGQQTHSYAYSGSNTIYDVAWYVGNSGNPAKAHPVGTKAANELGIYDMTGNVNEWCSDWYGGTYPYPRGVNNPTGAISGSSRVYRGGGWGTNVDECLVSDRSYGDPANRFGDRGFRLACSSR